MQAHVEGQVNVCMLHNMVVFRIAWPLLASTLLCFVEKQSSLLALPSCLHLHYHCQLFVLHHSIILAHLVLILLLLNARARREQVPAKGIQSQSHVSRLVCLWRAPAIHLMLQMNYNSMRMMMEERHSICNNIDSVCPPLSWTISNRLATLAPFVLSWHYRCDTCR